jgi:putative ABC transport system ATP-binding protein
MDCDKLLADVGLEGRKQNFPSQLSGGEQQRTAIARAIAKRPKLLLCDEPTGALDYQTGKSVLKLFQSLSVDKGITVVIITHNSAITAMADRVITLKSGSVSSNIINPNPVSVDLIEW